MLASLQYTTHAQTQLAIEDAVKDGKPNGYHITIQSLPATLSDSMDIMMEADLIMKGTYSFKKANDLNIPAVYKIFIVDQATGNRFELDPATRHSFTINRPLSKTFVLKLRKTTKSIEQVALNK